MEHSFWHMEALSKHQLLLFYGSSLIFIGHSTTHGVHVISQVVFMVLV